MVIVMKPYPILDLPEHLKDFEFKGCRQRKKQDAKEYFDWLINSTDRRIGILLDYLEERLTNDILEDLRRIGQSIAEILPDEQFSYLSKDEHVLYERRGRQFDIELSPSRRLTVQGYAMVADLGLLMTKSILNEFSDTLYWEIVSKPKNDIAYLLPQVAGFCKKTIFSPIGGTHALALGIINDNDNGDIWSKAYKRIRANAIKDKEMKENQRQNEQRE
jgi:hypothetical protein